ncbi:uncharacterized protein BKA55DRAFT_597632 [Fusarium redolens]|uniref:Uncharacterized protein n=1 Tax=Fusarium redolens TaxID=48865 RepID=A0A9P9GFR3_FUSRE|nr:uncharacterized protein BKA55DRAFT_597632 [Fusarium redolens]KAH7237159.1 hypothetical protein BKA55DRAFT_597632 [Fusarium redolens]
MEPAGLVIGVAGLAGLFNSCLEALTRSRLPKPASNDGARTTTTRPPVAICDASNAPQRRTRATGPDVNDSSGLHEPGLPFAAASRSRRGKMSWALWGKRGRVEQVELFEKLVQELHNLVPPTTGESTRPTHKPDPGCTDTLGQGMDSRRLKRGLEKTELIAIIMTNY